ncbi:hemagglutinin repeat-containing protein [Vibrio brasiliensis]|uniref:two-partner secretion domain-containing protein n=1 Tax=Vibrio brasiliensis TaxID=170652 RepID=UPI001EFDF7B8|nr:hemagglutinin repeat-containing protein [Vibrio brasiliensis]MCG9751054.1 hemagglutinin repeat-containing protein [Vibrio brasiliensis]
MDKKMNKLNIWLTYSLCGVLTLQPALANVIIASGSANTSKTQAGNGIEVVNIATPNSKGLSHNKYQQFNVDPSGLILNNSTEALSRSQLGGILQGNPHLKGKAANVILNEVTGANRSQLEGYTEVFGQQANVILANPYGITCDGCGFINTPRVTLSTGTPEIQNGLVSGFDVAEGNVTIEGLGLDATRQTYFDIISRTAEINANIHANDLSMVTGVNKVEYQTNKATEKSSGSATIKPKLAIDSSSLGGMYAGRISLVATEDGVGVNVGNLSSSQGDITIDADGNIVLGRSSSTQNTRLSSNQEILLTDTQSAGSDISISANQVAVNKAKVVSGRALSVGSSKLTLSDSTLESKQLLTKVADISLDQPSRVSSVTAQLRDLVSLGNQGKLSASDSLSVEGDSSALSGAGSIDTKTLKTQTNNLTLDTVVTTESAELNTKNNLVIGGAGKLSATQDINIVTDTLQLDGEINSSNAVDVKAGGTITTDGKIKANNAVLSAARLYQNGEVKTARSLNLNVTDELNQSSTGVIETNGELTIKAPNLTLGGLTHSNESVLIDSGRIVLAGEHSAINKVLITGDTLNQGSKLSANNNVMFDLSGDIKNTGAVHSTRSIELKGSNFTNSGSLKALDSLNLTVSSLINRGSLIAQGKLGIYANEDVENYGLTYSKGSSSFFLGGKFLNEGGSILAQDSLIIQKNSSMERAAEVKNLSGLIESKGELLIRANSVLNSWKKIDHSSSAKNHTPTSLDRIVSGVASCFFISCWASHKEIREKHLYTNLESKVVTEGKLGQIVSLENILITAISFVNKASEVYGANNVLIDVDSFNNTTYVDETTKVIGNYVIEAGTIHGSRSIGGGGDRDGDVISQKKTLQLISTDRTHKVNKQYNSSISAGKTVTVIAKTEADNGTRGNGKTFNKHSAYTPEAIETVKPLKSSSNGILFPSFSIPSNPNGLFLFSRGPRSKYLVETNPLISDMGQYLGSDYFRQSIGFDPESEVTFLGDAHYDTRAITQSIFERTGQRYLNDQIGSDLVQMQRLIDAAAKQKTLLGLQAGIALSREQIAKLTDDIIWYEPVIVEGIEVLAPKLYISNLRDRNFGSGALISGENIDILAGSITNRGNIKSKADLKLSSSGYIINEVGTLQANEDLEIEAQDNIENLSGSILGHNVKLVSNHGSVKSETLTDRLIVDNKGKLVDSTASNVVFEKTFMGDKATISSKGRLEITAGESITSVASVLHSIGDTKLDAKQDVTFSNIEDKQYRFLDLERNIEEQRKTRQLGSLLESRGNLSINVGRDANLVASEIIAANLVEIEAGNNVVVETAENNEYERYQDYRYTQIDNSNTHQASAISGQNVSVKAGNNVTVKGSTVKAQESVALAAKGDVDILAVNDSHYHYDKTVTKKSFGRSKTTINETYREAVKGSSISAGDSISIKAQNLDSVVTAGGDSDINIIGSALNADNEVTLSADGDVKLAAQTYKTFERHETIKKGFGGLSKRNKGTLEDATLLNSSYLINSGNTSINAGKDIGVIASEVTSGGEVNLNAVEDVLIAAGDVLKKSQQWDEKMSFLSGGNLFEMEKKRQGEETSTAQSSSIQSGGNLTVNGGSVKVVGSELNADNNVNLTADTGDVEILAAKETTKTFKSEEKLAISFDTVTKVLVGDVQDLVKVEDGTVKISLGEATYDKEKQKSDALNHKGSNISAKNDVSIDAESSILVEGSSLTADSDSNEQGDISLSAKDDVTIKESVDTLSEQSKEVHGKAEASVIVQHQAVEVAKAAVALKKSTKKLKQAKADYKQYKKGLDSLQSTLATLEQEYTDRKPGVLFEDVEELRDLISEVKSDEAWYVAGVALATQDVVSKTTLLVQQTAAAVQSTGTYGFNAGIHLDVEASKTTASSQQTTSQGSQLSGQNILVRAGQQEGNKANISGSALKANDNLEIAANEVNITSSQDTHNSKSETQSGQIGASMTVYGASTGINLNASFDRNQSNSSSVTHNNSQLNADNIAITSNQDTNIKGATVAANDSLTVDVGGNLNVASVQDRHSSSQKGAGISGGLSLSGGSDAGQLTGGSSGINASNGRTRTKQTVLTSLNSGGSADITVANNTDVKGALIATTDENGQDSGELNLTTGSLTFADLSNTSYNQNRSMGLNTSVGVNDGELDSTNNSTSVQYKNTSGYSKSKTLATIGQGQLTIADSENSDDTSRLNRDTEHTEKDLFTVDRKKGDIDVTVDHRLLTEEGRAQIKEDVKRTRLAGNAIADVITDESVEVSDTFEHMDVLQKELDIQKKIALESPEAAQILNNLDLANAEAKQYATEVYIQAYAAVMGITIDEARVVAIKSGSKGSHLVQNGKTTVELNDAETTNGADAANTIVHEGTHAAINQGRIGDKGKFEEQYTGLVGNYAEDTFKFVLDNYGLGEYKSGDVNQHIGNDSSPLVWLNNINSTIEHNTLGVTVDNRFLSKREYELANTLAAESNGKYTAEDIRNVMRHTKAQENEKYDAGVSPYVVDASKVNDKSFVDNSDGKLIVGQDGTGKGHYIVQDMGAIPLNDSAKQYLLDKDLGYSFFKIPETNKIVIDYLTGRPIDPASGAYIRPQTVDGKTFAVSYYPCATAECAATNSNMVKNEVSDAFIDATSAKALDDASTVANGALLLTPYGAASNIKNLETSYKYVKTVKAVGEATSQVTSAGSAYLSEEMVKFGTDEVFSRAIGQAATEMLGRNKADKLNLVVDVLELNELSEAIPDDKTIKQEVIEYVKQGEE